jgi:hypothetical protein
LSESQDRTEDEIIGIVKLEESFQMFEAYHQHRLMEKMPISFRSDEVGFLMGKVAALQEMVNYQQELLGKNIQQLAAANAEIERLKGMFAIELNFHQWYQEAGYAKIKGSEGMTKDDDLFINVNDPSREPITSQQLQNLFGEDHE